MTDSVPIKADAPSLSAQIVESRAALLRSAQATAEQVRRETRLAIGERVELQLKSMLQSGELEVRMRPMGTDSPTAGLAASGPGTSWSRILRVGVSEGPRPLLLEALARQVGAPPGSAGEATRALHAEVVALRPRILLRLLDDRAQAASATRAWFDAQLRQSLPRAQRLAPTLAHWSEQLGGPRATTGDTSRLPARAPTHAGINPEAGAITSNAQARQAVTDLLTRLPAPRDLTDPPRLERALKHSGIWLEALLAQAARQPPEQGAQVQRDLKAQLLRLADRIRLTTADGSETRPDSAKAASATRPGEAPTGPERSALTAPTAKPAPSPALAPEQEAAPTQGRGAQPPLKPGAELKPFEPTRPGPTSAPTSPPTTATDTAVGQLAREVDGLLKQIQTLQLHNAENGPEQPRWTLELPFQTSVGLYSLDADLEREADGRADGEPRWSMELRLDLPVLGPLLIRLSLRAGHLHGSLVAEQAAGADLLRAHLAELRARLEARDLVVASLHAREGPTGQPPRARARPLFSERA